MTDPSRKAFQEFLGDGKLRDDYVTDSYGEYLCPGTQIDWELWQASRKQMAEEAATVCAALIPNGCSTNIADVSRNQGIRACADAVRALATPTEGKT